MREVGVGGVGRRPRRRYRTLRPWLVVVGRTEPWPAPGVVPDGRPFDAVRRTIVVLWNGGSRRIVAADVDPEDPVVVAPSGPVLDVVVLRARGVGVRAEPRGAPGHPGSEVAVRFDELDARDGICLQVLHAATGDGPGVAARGTVGPVALGAGTRGRPGSPPPVRRWPFPVRAARAYLHGGAEAAEQSVVAQVADKPLAAQLWYWQVPRWFRKAVSDDAYRAAAARIADRTP